MTRLLNDIFLFLGLLAAAASLTPPAILPASPPVSSPPVSSSLATGPLGHGSHTTKPVAMQNTVRTHFRSSQHAAKVPVAPAMNGQWQAEAKQMQVLAGSGKHVESVAPLLSLAAVVAMAAAGVHWWRTTASKRWALGELPRPCAQQSTVILEMNTLEGAKAEHVALEPQKFAVAAFTGESNFGGAGRQTSEKIAMRAGVPWGKQLEPPNFLRQKGSYDMKPAYKSRIMLMRKARFMFGKQRNLRQEKWLKKMGITAGRDYKMYYPQFIKDRIVGYTGPESHPDNPDWPAHSPGYKGCRALADTSTKASGFAGTVFVSGAESVRSLGFATKHRAGKGAQRWRRAALASAVTRWAAKPKTKTPAKGKEFKLKPCEHGGVRRPHCLPKPHYMIADCMADLLMTRHPNGILRSRGRGWKHWTTEKRDEQLAKLEKEGF